MSIVAIQGAVELGLIFAILSLGIFLSFRVLDIPDLTVDGSFTFGAAASVVLTTVGHPVLGILAGIAAGFLAGLVTGLLQTKLRVQPLLAGIITMTGLYSINMHVMGGKSNLPITNAMQTVYTMTKGIFGGLEGLVLTLLVCAAVFVFIYLFLGTKLGLSIRATGDNEDMVRSSSINADKTKMVGLALANAFVGLAGGLFGQYQKFADIGMGIGMIIIGLASIIIGEVLLSRKSILRNMLAAVVGAVVYRFIITVVLALGMPTQDLKLLSALIVAAAMAIPVIKAKIAFSRQKAKNRREAAGDAGAQDSQ